MLANGFLNALVVVSTMLVNMEKEIWKDVPQYEEFYQINNFGVIKSKGRLVEVPDYQNAHAYCSGFSYVKPGRIMKQRLNAYGYYVINLSKDGKQKGHMVHRLVAEAFIPNANNLPFINHKDENKTNNHISNLEWCTAEYNTNYGTCLERRSISQRTANKNMKSVIAYNDEEQIEFVSVRGAARELNLHQSNIQHAVKYGKRCGKYYWKFK